MENILDKLSELVYDLISIFIPATFFYLIIGLIHSHDIFAAMDFSVQGLNLSRGVLIGILLFILGQVIFSFANVIIPRIFTKLFGNPRTDLIRRVTSKPKGEKKITQNILIGLVENNDYYTENVEKGVRIITNDKDFSITTKDSIEVAFEICRNYVMENSNNRSIFITKEQAYGEMSRGIILCCLGLLIWLPVYELFLGDVKAIVLKLMLIILTLVSFSFRYLQSRDVIAYFIYSTFCSLIYSKESNKYEKGKT